MMRSAHVVDLELWAQSVCAAQLADEIASRLGVRTADAYFCLRTIPDNLLPMLDCPEGWMALAGLIASDLGAPFLDYSPTVH